MKKANKRMRDEATRGSRRSHWSPKMVHEVARVLVTAHSIGLSISRLFPTCLVDVGNDMSHYNELGE